MAKILVVDDEPGYLQHLSAILADDGHEVETAATGPQALEIGERFGPAILLADWKLKGQLGGLHVARLLFARNPGLATIMMTGYSAKSIQLEAQDLPNLLVLEKPFEADTVRDLIRQAVPGAEGSAARSC